MKIVHITTVPESLNFLSGQIQYMQDREFDVRAISSPGEILASVSKREKIAVYGINMPRSITPFKDVIALFQIWRLLKSISPDIVHAHTPKGGLLGIVAAWLARVPVRVYHIHGLPLMTAQGAKRFLLRWSEKVSCKLAIQVLCVSRSIREVAISDHLCSPSKIKVLLNGSINGVDAEHHFNPRCLGEDVRAGIRKKYAIPHEAIVIGFVGRIVRDKGIIELSKAWQKIREEDPNLFLMLVGPIEPQDPIPSEIIRSFESDERVCLVGRTDDIAPFYKAMDLVVLPTYREGLPVVPLEAASMELPLIATNIPGCVEAIEDNVTGTLVLPKNVEQLVEALRLYCGDAELRVNRGRAGRERVKQYFNQEVIWEAMYQEYMSLLHVPEKNS